MKHETQFGQKLAKVAQNVATEFRRAGVTYDQSRQVVKLVRKALNLKPSTGRQVMPKSLTEQQIESLFSVISESQDYLLFKLAYSCALRVSAICDLKAEDIDLEGCTVRIRWNKSNFGVIPFPKSIQPLLRMHMKAHPSWVYLFQSPQRSKEGSAKTYSTRLVQLKFKNYASKAGLSADVSIHALRHSCLTHLAAKGLSSSQLQGISLHRSKSSLDSYVRLGAAEVREAYNGVMK